MQSTGRRRQLALVYFLRLLATILCSIRFLHLEVLTGSGKKVLEIVCTARVLRTGFPTGGTLVARAHQTAHVSLVRIALCSANLTIAATLRLTALTPAHL